MGLVKFTAKMFKLNALEGKLLVREAVQVMMRNSIRAMIRAAIPHIPVDTGMARGSFLHLGRALRVAVPIKTKKTRTVTVNGRTYTVNNANAKYYHPPARGQLKTPELGAQLTDVNGVPSSGLSFKDVVADQNGVAVFEFEPKTFHYILNDITGSIGTGPWRSLEAGKAAFMASMIAQGSKAIPSIRKYLYTATLKVKDSGIQTSGFKPVRK